MKALPSKERLDELFRYNGRDLVRKVAVGSKIKAGEIAGSVDKRGYNVVVVDRVVYKAHRLIWKMSHATDPYHIDHINGDRLDNRIDNLRSVSGKENNQNAKLGVNNKSKRIGVNWHRASGKYTAQINGEGKKVYLGVFENIEDAISARRSAEKKYGYHKNHGRP